jgi:hypothetical protein
VPHEQFGREFVGDIQSEVADERDVRKLSAEQVDPGEVADEQHIGTAVGDETEVAILGGLLDAERGQPDRNASAAGTSNGVVVTPKVFEVAVDEGRTGGEGGVELGQRTAENGEI